ncbi:hypothetical protein DES53_11576 [Roseimicrobium gellanilyticum]|uniref:Uncharacterized protein n=1 Tax=Roseimicrobium gellanilyticum TaxID=748857 RepID=A0A366H4J7_9BACT|nr:hypothetical protein [Roseimicrobium gellanilyticum]RBP36935.1 hypothetical protein DES53_11576 [Roseimicrobium gellanilyticum]
MSRRAKLITLGIFFLLGIGTATLLWITWSPENPLRFRVLSEHLEHSPSYKEPLRVLEVEMENTSVATIMVRYGYLDYARDEGDTGKPAGLGMLGSLIEQKAVYALPAIIPSRRTIRHRLVFEEDVPKDTPYREVVVDYAWSSRTREMVWRGSQWLYGVLPESLGSRLLFLPNNFSTATLEPATVQPAERKIP